MSTTMGGLEIIVDSGTKAADRLHLCPKPNNSVTVIVTSMNPSIKALERAAELAKPSSARINVITVEVVPFPLPLDEPPVPAGFTARRFEEIAGKLPARAHVLTYLCRNPWDALNRILDRNCPVVIGVRKRWWPTRESRLAGRLRRAGYDVISINQE